jgi:hypothetical protein
MADGDPELEVVAALGWTEEPVCRSAARTPTGSATLKVNQCDLSQRWFIRFFMVMG